MRTAGARWILLAVTAAICCGGRPSYRKKEAPCRPAALPQCMSADSVSVADALAAEPGDTLTVRGRVQLDVMACLLSGHDCSATLRLVGDEASDSLMIRGNNIGCHGHSESTLCCGIDMLDKHVVAIGTLGQAELGPALVVASVCAP